MTVEAAKQHNVPVELGIAVAQIESQFDPAAYYQGARGVMQVMPATARGLGYSGTLGGLHDPKTNLDLGMKLLRICLDKHNNDWGSAASCYNGGSKAYAKRVLRAVNGESNNGKARPTQQSKRSKEPPVGPASPNPYRNAQASSGSEK